MSLIKEFGIQLYSIRDIITEDYLGYFKKMGEIGFNYCEAWGPMGGYSPEDQKEYLEKAGIPAVSAHVNIEVFDDDKIDATLEHYKKLGVKYLNLAWYEFHTREEALVLAKRLSEIADRIAEAGFTFGYHNHNHEFEKVDGEYLLDILCANTDPDKLILELDLFWMQVSGVDIPAFLRKHGKRVRELHLKQVSRDEPIRQVDLADGVIDFAEIISVGKEIGVEYFILEQEGYPIDPLTSVINGYNHIMSL